MAAIIVFTSGFGNVHLWSQYRQVLAEVVVPCCHLRQRVAMLPVSHWAMGTGSGFSNGQNRAA